MVLALSSFHAIALPQLDLHHIAQSAEYDPTTGQPGEHHAHPIDIRASWEHHCSERKPLMFFTTDALSILTPIIVTPIVRLPRVTKRNSNPFRHARFYAPTSATVSRPEPA